MLTRREKLLIRPWQQRRYNNHCKMVNSALPAIDTQPPPIRNHVNDKLKKQQWETERTTKIEKDNCRLLQRMSNIMKTKRLDNVWATSPPNFLHRVGIYNPKQQISSSELETLDSLELSPRMAATRNSHCLACNPHKYRPIKQIPEDRVPWEPRHSAASRVQSSNSTITYQTPPDFWSRRSYSGTSRESTSHLILTRGSLKLDVKFPPHTTVTLEDGRTKQSRMLQKDFCECKAISHQKK